MPTEFDMDWPNSRRRASFIERPWHLALSSDDLRAILAQNGEDGTTYLLSARIGATVVDLLLAETAYQKVERAAQHWGVAGHWQEIRAKP